MPSMRPLSVLAIRLPQILGWTVDPQPLAEPFLDKNDYLYARQKVSDSWFGVQQSVVKKVYPQYEPPKVSMGRS